jgi:hypothetical protein
VSRVTRLDKSRELQTKVTSFVTVLSQITGSGLPSDFLRRLAHLIDGVEDDEFEGSLDSVDRDI